MQIQEMTDEFQEATDFQSQALYQLAQQQQLIALFFTSLAASEEAELQKRLRQLDAVMVVSDGDVFGLLKLPALHLLAQHWLSWFPGDKAGEQTLQRILTAHDLDWQVAGKRFKLRDTSIVYGIMNITPDSFYDGGRYTTMDAVLAHVDEMLAAGADVIEVNGQTTRPGYTEVTPEVEIERTIPYIKAITSRFPEAILAIDTYKVPVMEAAIDAGVAIINDVNSFTDEPAKVKLMAQSNVGLLTMLNGRNFDFNVMTDEAHQFFEDNLNELTAAGIDRDRIAIDQGLGYANAKVQNDDQDYVIMNNTDQFNDLKRPMMVAVSRKGYMANLLGLKKDERLPMTLVSEVAMMQKGGKIIRVHDVKETRQMVTLLDRINQGYWLA
ncbi:dihydropteroate synthase [Lactobacillus sp. LC28-10]|uniref:Dihydropteroate synthase n=1 Tax=Secundilactobacillus angelensis TaxID=2722706 RepID=A0ABX1L1Q9_9LACO|nr:dihydropteroate synthase [Secundilactobacillus angelensis]MCH5463369.1 dihydropteroate synthase [Secundilactobacillus angelensis]NLR19402.1 dihydropteroate synthase [Secundilactobacillus angelensis]